MSSQSHVGAFTEQPGRRRRRSSSLCCCLRLEAHKGSWEPSGGLGAARTGNSPRAGAIFTGKELSFNVAPALPGGGWTGGREGGWGCGGCRGAGRRGCSKESQPLIYHTQDLSLALMSRDIQRHRGGRNRAATRSPERRRIK